MAAVRVSFVLVNWHQEEATAHCVDSIKAQQTGAELEIVLVDNESTAESSARLRSIPGVRYVASTQNLGFTGGMNTGFTLATGDYLAAVNNDAVLAPDWLEQGLAQLALEGVGLVGGKELFWDDANPPFDPSNRASTLCLVDPGEGWSFRSSRPAPTQDVYALDGNNLLLTSRLVHELGGFDEDFFAYYEDVDLCARALAAGYRVRYCAEMQVWHRRNLSSDAVPYRRQFLAQRNHLTFVARHFPEGCWRQAVRRNALQYLLFGLAGRPSGLRGWRGAPPLGGTSRRAYLASGWWGITHGRYLATKRQQAAAAGQRSEAYRARLLPDRVPTQDPPTG